MRKAMFGLAVAMALAAAAPAQAGAVLDRVKARGEVRCGTSTGTTGGAFHSIDSAGQRRGFLIDMCRAIAAALFNDPAKGIIQGMQFVQTFTAVKTGEVDVVTWTHTYTSSRDTNLGYEFPVVYYYSGQSFMVPKATNIARLEQLSGAAICVVSGSNIAAVIEDAFKQRNMTFRPVSFENVDSMVAAYRAGRCDAISTEPPVLAGYRSTFRDPAEHVILDVLISREPLAPMIAEGDFEWLNVLRWVFWATILAEEHGITQANVEAMRRTSTEPEVRRLLGVEGDIAQKMGLSPDWAVNVIRTVGNYGEIYDRHFGPNTPANLPRGLNRLWSQGGLMFVPPYR
jgi:general L-amino acid transport system substrate-binding protein